MSANLSANPTRPHDIQLVEQLAARKSKSRMGVQLVQWLIGSAEYLTYVVTFGVLFALRVAPEHLPGREWVVSEWLEIPVALDYALFLAGFLGILLFILYQKHFFEWNQERQLSDEIVVIAKTVAIAFLITIGLTFLIKNTMIYSRMLLVLFVSFTFVEAALFRYVRKRTLYRLKVRGALEQNILIVGAGRVGQELLEQLTRSSIKGNRFVGFLDDDKDKQGVIGGIAELEPIIYREKVDILYITIPSERQMIHRLLQRIYKYNIEIRIIPELYDRISTVFEYRNGHEYPYLQIVKTPLRGINLIIKRTMDLLLSFIGLILLSPVFVLIGIAIKMDSRGPVLFKQKRIGKNGVPFQMIKFRSMVVDAEKQRRRLTKRGGMNGLAFKMKDDPRVTRVGAILRKYSLDELPQLYNVLLGQMSLIGPRPPLPSEVEQYTDYHWRRMDVRPGMTGLWQVSGRSNLSFEEWVDLDIEYIERWSLSLEMKILIKTVPVVLKGKGAY